jgi:hypothetical protein
MAADAGEGDGADGMAASMEEVTGARSPTPPIPARSGRCASIFTPAVAVVTVLSSYLRITVQFERNRELEKIEQRFGEVYKRESDAYFAVWKTIAQAYRLLSELERGTFDAGSSENIAEAFGEAEIYLFILSAEHQGRFYSYWQKANELLALISTAATAGLEVGALDRTNVAAVRRL